MYVSAPLLQLLRHNLMGKLFTPSKAVMKYHIKPQSFGKQTLLSKTL